MPVRARRGAPNRRRRIRQARDVASRSKIRQDRRRPLDDDHGIPLEESEPMATTVISPLALQVPDAVHAYLRAAIVAVDTELGSGYAKTTPMCSAPSLERAARSMRPKCCASRATRGIDRSRRLPAGTCCRSRSVHGAVLILFKPSSAPHS